MIDSYAFGRIVIDGQSYTSDLILFPDRIFSPWWRKKGHILCLDDLEEIPFEDYEVLIVGTGFFGAMKVEKEVQEFMRENGIQIFAKKTQAAARQYNDTGPHERVVGAFHLTC
ncbi:MAG: Mth938-like domain-containing protein [Candidatus Aminicenantes bacterium]|jgi:hypothetical protein